MSKLKMTLNIEDNKKPLQITALREAIKLAGGQTALSKKINCNQQNISYWLKTGNVSPASVIPIENATGVSRRKLRPDLYPHNKAA